MVRTPASGDPAPHPRAGSLSLQEAADRLGVHYMTAYRYVRTGRLPAVQIGSQWWVDPRDLRGATGKEAVAGRPRAVTRQSSRRAAAKRLEGRLVAGDEAGAWAIIEARLGAGSSPDDVILDELGEAMRSVGTRWKAGEYTVDDEHRASGVAARLVARLGARFTKRGPSQAERHPRHASARAPRAAHRHGRQRAARPRVRRRRPWRRCPGRCVRSCGPKDLAPTRGCGGGDLGKS